MVSILTDGATEQTHGISEAVFTVAASQSYQGINECLHHSWAERNGREDWRRYSSRIGTDFD